MKYIIILLSLLGVVHAQDSLRTELAAAAAVSNSVERLAAYDAIAEKYQLAPGTKATGKTSGKWRIRVDTSPLDDSQTVVGSLSADNEIKVGYRTDTPTLIVRYKEGELEAYISYDAFLGSDGTEVTLFCFGRNWTNAGHRLV